MKRFSILILISLFWNTAYSQNRTDVLVDSLINFRNSTQYNSSLVYLLSDEVTHIYRGDLPENNVRFLNLIQFVLEDAESIKDTNILAKTNYNLGKYYISAGSSYSKAIPAFLKSLSFYEQVNDSLGISKCYMQMGLIGYITQYFEDGIKNFDLSLDYADNPTSVYLKAITYTELEEYDKAKREFLIALKSFKEIGRQQSISECYMYLGKLYIDEGLLDSAHYFLKLAIENVINSSEVQNLSRPYAFMSNYFLKAEQLDSAKYYAESCLKIIANNSRDELSVVIASETLSKVYELEGNYEKANQYLKIYYRSKYENVQGDTKQKIAEMKSMFNFKKQMNEEKHKHQEEIRRKNYTKNILIVSGLFALIMAIALWSRLQFIRKSRTELEKEKNISENLLLNILPHEIAQELKIKGKAEAQNFDLVSILFTDFIGFTETSARLSASELVDEINYCFKGFDEIIEKYGIEKIKTIGDAYMAAGGLPVPTDDSIRNTVLASLEMQAFIKKRKEENQSKGKPAFEMRVGIHTGPVVAGIVGVKKFQYDVWGDTVNTASRIESNGEAEKVNISQATYELLKNDPQFTFESRGKIEAKGKGTLDMYFVQRNEV